MSRVLDKFTYTTTYKQEFCVAPQLPRDFKNVEEIFEDCKGKYIPGAAVGSPPDPTTLGMCSCQAGGQMPPRGAKARGQPTNLDKTCICFSCGKCALPLPPPIKKKIEDARNFEGVRKNSQSEGRKSDYERDYNQEDLFQPAPRFECKDGDQEVKPEPICPRFKRLRPVTRGKYGGQFEGDGGRARDPFWMQDRRDERREPDVPRMRRQPPRGEVRDVIHREEPRPRVGRRSSNPTPFWMQERRDERRDPDVQRLRRHPPRGEVRDVIHREEPRPKVGRRSSNPTPFWMQERRDERREPDVQRLRRHPPRGEVRDVIHGEEARARRNSNPLPGRRQPVSRSGSDVRIPGPFWIRQRPDERREVDVLRKRKFKVRNQVKEMIHGGEVAGPSTAAQASAYEPMPGPSHADDGEDYKARRDHLSEEATIQGIIVEETDEEDDDQAEPFPFKRTCRCAPGPAESGPDGWMLERDWGDLRAKQPRGEENRFDIPSDVEETIRQPPAARLSCAPEAEVSNYDQPNAFMRKLYEKYPYLYQVLKETPPEELVSRVFKDRFLSTYQVDYLHMGIGKEQLPEGGARKEEKFTGPDGEPEPQVIPGCSYRHSQKGDFGRKKPTEKDKKEKEETPANEEEKDEPRVSEYMATISKLGNEIIQDQLYKVAQITKNMKNQYKKM